MAFTQVYWHSSSGSGADIHVLRGQVSRPLDTRLVLQSDNEGWVLASYWRAPTLPLLPSFRQVTALQFVPIFPFNWAHGIRVDANTGEVHVNGLTPPSPTVPNFIIEARVAHTNPAVTNPLVLPIRVHIHEDIVDARLTPAIIGVRVGPFDPHDYELKLRILAQFSDDTVGDLSFAWGDNPTTQPAWHSSDSRVAVDVWGRISSTGPVGISPRPTIGCTLPPDFGNFPATPAEVDTLPPWSTPIPVKLATKSAGARKTTIVPNVLFLSDGFTIGQEARFEKYVADLVERIQKNALLYPMNQIASKMNFWTAFVPVNTNHNGSASALNLLWFKNRPAGQCGDMPIPSRPPSVAGVAQISTVEHLLYQVGLPLPADNVAPSTLIQHQKEKMGATGAWTLLYGLNHIHIDSSQSAVSPAHRLSPADFQSKLFQKWCALGDSTLALDVNTPLGICTGAHPPQVWDPIYVGKAMGMHPLRTKNAMLVELINHLDDGGVSGMANFGTLWTDPARAANNRVFVLSAGSRSVGFARDGIVYEGMADFESVLATPSAPRALPPLPARAPRFVDLLPYAIPAKASVVKVTVTAHEIAHTLFLGDEYGGPQNPGQLTQVVGPSDARVALLFSPPTGVGQSITLTTDAGAVLGSGLNLTSSTGLLLITEEVFGDAVKKAWYAAASGSLTLGFLETVSE
jgi:hypothetical protein